MKHNYKMIVNYDGSRYFGWEHQPNTDMTIQGKLETVLTRMCSKDDAASNGDTYRNDNKASKDGTANKCDTTSAEPVTVIGAGRTDAGVHARAMTCNAILDTELSEDEIRAYMNKYLPDDIGVSELSICKDRFHSRYKASGKTYRYSLYFGDVKPVFERKYLTILESKPDVEAMRRASEYLIGEHDFKSFCGNSHFKKSTVRNIDHIEITENGPYIRIYIHGDGFLQNMVRIISGTLIEIGLGKRDADSMKDILEAYDRQKAGYTADAKGLCLMKVDYD